jgi:C1A family cysteine protease
MVTVKKDIRSRFLMARDQGPRPTCLAFAISDAHSAERPPHESFSADYLYYHALERMPPNHGDNGVGVMQAIDALRVNGQPFETAWPYSAVLPTDLKMWKPPGKVAVLFATGTSEVSHIDSICAFLDKDRATVLVFVPTERFYYADATGFLPARSPDPSLPQSHAVVAVGYGEASGGRQILIRNSWGAAWGQQGYAWLAEDYIATRILSVVSIHPN